MTVTAVQVPDAMVNDDYFENSQVALAWGQTR